MLQPEGYTNRLNIPRKRGGRGGIGYENSIRVEEKNLLSYIKNDARPLLLEGK